MERIVRVDDFMYEQLPRPDEPLRGHVPDPFKFNQRAIQDLTRRTNEWFPGNVFVITRLLANQHHRRAFRSFAKDRLRRSFVQMTRCAMSCCFAYCAQT